MVILWILLLVCGIWLALTELPAGKDGHNPLPYVLALTPFLYIPLTIFVVFGVLEKDWPYVVCAAMVLLAALARKTQYILNNIQAPNTAKRVAEYYARKRELAEQAGKSADQTSKEHRAARQRLDGNHPGTFRVMTLNCRYGRANGIEIIHAVERNDIALLALQEVSDDLIADLKNEGIEALLPYHVQGAELPTDNGGFNAIFSRVEPNETTASAVEIPAAEVPAMKFTINEDQSITFASAHPKSPMRGCREWSEGIRDLGKLAEQVQPSRQRQMYSYTGRPLEVDDIRTDVEATQDGQISVATMSAQNAAGTAELNEDNTIRVRQADGTSETVTFEPKQPDAYEAVAGFAGDPTQQKGAVNARGYGYGTDANRRDMVVIMGDLNSSIPHPSFRALLNSGLNDSALVEAKGIHATYPSWLPWPRIVLDHILFTRYLTASQVKQIRVDGSDHLGLTATLHFTK